MEIWQDHSLRQKVNQLYFQGLSQQEVAKKLGVTYRQVVYWMERWAIPRRTRSEATYRKRNPSGDPFRIKEKLTPRERELKGLGVGLYLGEGTRSSSDAVRLGNTNPKIIIMFLNFLVGICGINQRKLRFGLQIFNDGNPQKAMNFWIQELKEFNITNDQFQSVVITAPRGRGRYRKKIQHGVLTVYYCNTKLRSSLEKMLA